MRRLFDPIFEPVARRTISRWGRVGGSVDPFSLFTHDVDWTTGTVTKGGPQSFTGSPGAGNLFRQGGNAVICYAPNASGTLSAMSSTAFRRTNLGEWQYPSINTRALWNRDFTNAVWTKQAGVTATKNQTGADGAANACSLLAWTIDNAEIAQAITSAVLDRILQVDVRRVSGSDPLEASIDGGTWQTVAFTGASFDVMNPSVLFQAAVTDPNVKFRSKAGNSFAVDFLLTISPPTNWPSMTPIHSRPIVTSATVQTFVERAYASFPDSSPLATIARGAFGFYLQQRGYPNHPITSASNFQVSVAPDGTVKFQNGASGQCVTSAGVWKSGLTQVNKIAGYCDGATLKLACNGVLAGAPTGVVGLDAALDHWDLGTNGSGANSIFGINERICMGPNLTFTDAQLIAMTT